MELNETDSKTSRLYSADHAAWGADLDPAGQRRLWLFLKIVADGHSIAEAFDAAQKVEQFLMSGSARARVPSSATSTVPGYDLASLWASPSRRRLLDQATKESFALEAARNNDNQHLA